MFLLQSYEPPLLMCAMNELLDLITREASTLPTVVAPFLVSASKLKFNNRSLEASSRKASLRYVQVGIETETSKPFTFRIQKPPPLMQIHYEPFSCLLHLARVKRLPTSILIGQRSSSLSHKALDEELQVIHDIGELVASCTGLSFSRDRIKWNASKTPKEEESGLYGKSSQVRSGLFHDPTLLVFSWPCTIFPICTLVKNLILSRIKSMSVCFFKGYL